MKKRLIVCFLMVCLALGLVACKKGGTESVSDTASDKEITEDNTSEGTEDTENTEDTETEATEEIEIVDGIPEGPEGLDFGPDNIGFYMEGETFTLPMPYSEFQEKVAELGWSVNENKVIYHAPDERFSEGNVRGYAYAKIRFERPVENQEYPEEFHIVVTNSVDSKKDVDLSDPDVHVIYFYMHMRANELGEWDEDYNYNVVGYTKYNINSQLYLTKEIGMGRNIYNAHSVWGEPSVDGAYEWMYASEATDSIPLRNNDPVIGTSIFLEEARYTIGLSGDSDNEIYHVLFGDSPAGEHIINTICVVNNPYMK